MLSELVKSGRDLPPPSIVWLELKLWCAVVQDYCPHEQSKYSELYRLQHFRLSAYRFKLGVSLCLRLLEKSGDKPDGESQCIEHLIGQGHDADGAAQCQRAARNLYEALDHSLDETALDHFDSERAVNISQWAKNLESETSSA